MPSEKPRKFHLMTTDIRDQVASYIQRQPIVPLQVVTIENFVPCSTQSQKSAWWGWMTIIGDHTGYSKREADYWVRNHFLEATSVVIEGKEMDYLPTVADISRPQMTMLIEQVLAWAATDLGIRLPTRGDK